MWARRPPLWQRPGVQRLLASRAFMTGLALLGVVLVVIVLAPWISPSDPNRMAVRARFRPPSMEIAIVLAPEWKNERGTKE